MASKIQVRRDTLSNWNANNPVLSSGEIAFVTDKNKFKVGNGSSAFSSLPYLQADAYIDSVILGTDTTGNYVETMISGDGINLSGQGSESASVTVTNTGVLSLSGTTNEVEVSASTGNITVSLPTTINANTTGTAASLTTARTIALSGDVSGSASFDGSASVEIIATIQPDSVALGSDTTGNYVSQVTGSGAGISVTGSGESASVTIENTGVTSLAGTENEIDISASTGSVTLSLPSTINANTTGSAATLTNSRIIALSGDVSGSVTFDGSASVDITTQIQPNSVALGTDTTGNYVATATAGSGISISGSGSENAAITISNTGVKSLTGTANQISVSASNGDPTISLPSAVTFPGTVTLNADPTQALQAATKQYVDAVAQGLHIHASVAAATTASVNLSDPPSSIDNVSLSNNMRILVKDQSNAAQNGIYVFNGSSLVRADDYDTAGEVQAGDFVFVSGGDTYNSTGWVQENDVTTLGTDPIVWDQFSGAGTYSAGTGLALNGSVFSNTGVLSLAGTTNEVEVSASSGAVTISLPSTINANTTGSAATLTTSRTIELTGDVTGSATFNGGANATIAATIAPNSVALGTDTTGNYVATITGTANQVTVTGSGSESAGVTLSLPATINANTTGSAATLTTSRTIQLSGDVSGSASFNGGANASISSTLANTAVTPATYGSASATGVFTVDSKGRITGASNTPIAIAQSAVTNLTTDLGLKANLASPTFTGIPAAPTAAADTNTTQVATTAYVVGQAGSSTPLANGTAAVGTSLRYARQDHIHPTDTSRAPLASPTFTGTVTVPTPNNPTDAATKAYVDSVAEGLHIHASVAAATTASVNLTTPPATIDGVTLTNNMRVLVKNQSNNAQNGIYVFSTSTGQLSRASDFDSASEIDGGDFVFVTGGTVNDNTGWVQTETVTNIGTDPIIFTQFSGAGTYTAGTGLQLDGTVFSNTGVLSLAGTTNEVEVSASSGAITVSLPSTINANTTGSAATLTTSRTIQLSGDVSGSATFNGSANASITSTLANTAVTPATYGSASAVGTVTVDSKGRITGASNTPIAIAQSAVANLTTDLGLKANLASPTFTGTPTSSTAAVDTNTTQIATTAFVLAQASVSNPLALGSVSQGTSTRYARQDHVHPTTGLGLTSGKLSQFAATTSAELAGVISDETGSGALVFANSPTFTTPNIGAATGTSFNSITGLSSTTPVVDGTAAVGTGTTVARADHVHPTDTSRAPLASPTFTGTVTIPSLSLTQADTATAATHYMVEIATDGLVRPKTLADVRTEIVTTAAVNSAAATTVGTVTTGTWSATNIALNRGGTNASLTAANGAVVYSTASELALTSVGTAGQVLTSNGAGAPTWQEAASGGFDGFFLAGM